FKPLEAYFRNDPEAEWGYSVKLGIYKVHVVVDALSELPIALGVTPASVHDRRLFRRLLWRSMKLGGIRVVEADAACDSRKNREYAVSHGIKKENQGKEEMGCRA
ncbi:MAG: transposase, partial [Nitrososphaerota archaeon]